MTEIGRLTKRPEYLRVAAARRKWVTPGMVVQALPRNREELSGTEREAGAGEDARLGITVSRKVGNSVARNRARRRLRAVAREVLPLVARPGTDYVVIGRAGTLTRGYAELCDDLRSAVRRLNDGGALSGGRRRRGGRHKPTSPSSGVRDDG